MPPSKTEKLFANVFPAFFESAPVLCLAADRNFITFYVNAFYKEIYGITLKAIKAL